MDGMLMLPTFFTFEDVAVTSFDYCDIYISTIIFDHIEASGVSSPL